RRSPIVKVRVRTEWHQSANGCWSLSLGERGCRVRVVQREPGGGFHRVVWIKDHGPQWATLRTRSRAEARERGEALLKALLVDGGPPDRPPLTLGELWDRYQQEAPAYR